MLLIVQVTVFSVIALEFWGFWVLMMERSLTNQLRRGLRVALAMITCGVAHTVWMWYTTTTKDPDVFMMSVGPVAVDVAMGGFVLFVLYQKWQGFNDPENKRWRGRE